MINRLQLTASGLLVAILFVSFTVDAQAQYWRKRAQIVAPVEPETPTIALLDSIVTYVEESDSIKVRRSPEDPTRHTGMELSNLLVEEAALDITSANNVFIDYQFDLDRKGFEESIRAIRFIYRPPGGAAGQDIPIMYLSAKKDPWLNRLLTQKGTTGENLMALSTFRDQLAFARVVRNMQAQITQIGDQPVRDGFERKKRQLVREITQLTYR